MDLKICPCICLPSAPALSQQLIAVFGLLKSSISGSFAEMFIWVNFIPVPVLDIVCSNCKTSFLPSQYIQARHNNEPKEAENLCLLVVPYLTFFAITDFCLCFFFRNSYRTLRVHLTFYPSIFKQIYLLQIAVITFVTKIV
ncbi:hypothetical protein CHS0354_004394 [Potamilus streckersoni]|uniref:Uncharacterized protein n=1 Tax=Potamilus streckersoni TaxID=2493646 RepID=A0AAE0T005_9BIVA|nr:hypothetical protein CHS0354_004394 [Potamilus streckersoni]